MTGGRVLTIPIMCAGLGARAILRVSAACWVGAAKACRSHCPVVNPSEADEVEPPMLVRALMSPSVRNCRVNVTDWLRVRSPAEESLR